MFESAILTSSSAMAWILFLALFPMVFFWWRKAWRIFFKKDYSDVCIKKGKAPARPKKWAIFVGIGNILSGAVALLIIVKVGLFTYYYHDINFIADTFSAWSEVIGITIWVKILFEFILKQQAHPMKFGRKKKEETIAA